MSPRGIPCVSQGDEWGGAESLPAALSPEVWLSAVSASSAFARWTAHTAGAFPWLFALGNVPRVSAWACDFLRAEMSLLGSLGLEIPCTPGLGGVPGSQPVASW